MTRPFDGKVQCPHCKDWHTAETGFERWFRNHPDLDSQVIGVVRFDCDILLHRYKVINDKKALADGVPRDIQCIMFVEVKCRGKDVDAYQRDTLSMFSQMLRNRRRNRHSDRHGLHASEHVPPAKIKSQLLGRKVAVWAFGGHLLQLERDLPEEGWLLWDHRPIDVPTLLKLFRFEVDPDTLRKIDWRRRYSAFREMRPLLPGMN